MVASSTRFYVDGVTAGPDGNLWFTEVGNHGKIGTMTTAGALTEYPRPPES